MRQLSFDNEQVNALQQGSPIVLPDDAGVRTQVFPLAAVVSGNSARSGDEPGIGEDDQVVLDWNQLVCLRLGKGYEVRTRAGEPIFVNGPDDTRA